MGPLKVFILPLLAVAVVNAASATAATVVINNGLAPPNPANVIDASNSFPGDQVLVHDVGCDATVTAGGDPGSYQSCPVAGQPTHVEMSAGGEVGPLDVMDNSTFTMSGGFVRDNIFVRQSAHGTVTDGSVGEDLRVVDDATALLVGGSIDNLFASEFSDVTVTGGELRVGPSDAGLLVAQDSALLTIVGSNFAVNGSAVPLGPISATSGRLTGLFASGEPIDNDFLVEGSASIVLTTACDDGLDNDADNLIDLQDPACRDSLWTRENAQCQDGNNNDTDEGIDFDGGASIWGEPIAPADPQCTSFWDNREATNPPPTCGLGPELVLLTPLPMLAHSRRRRVRA